MKFKEGDTVKCIRENRGTHWLQEGQVGTVTRADPDTYGYDRFDYLVACIDNPQYDQWVSENDIDFLRTQ